MTDNNTKKDNDERTEWCEGCDQIFNRDSLESVEMKHGGVELLCQRCITQSYEMMK